MANRITPFELETYSKTNIKPKSAINRIPSLIENVKLVSGNLTEISDEIKILTTSQLISSDFIEEATNITNIIINISNSLYDVMNSLLTDTLERIRSINDQSQSFADDLALGEENIRKALEEISGLKEKLPTAPTGDTSQRNLLEDPVDTHRNLLEPTEGIRIYDRPIPVTEEGLRSAFAETNATVTKYETLDNGIIKVTTKRNDSGEQDVYYFPQELTKDSSAVAYFPGSNGNYDSAVVMGIIEKSEGITSPIAVSRDAYNNKGNTSNNMASILESMGGKIDNLTVASFSASGDTGIYEANDFLATHPDAKVRIVSSDPYSLGNLPKYVEGQTSPIQNVLDHGVEFNFLAGHDYRLIGGKCKSNLNDAGISDNNIYFMNTRSTDHATINREMATNVLPYIQGDKDSLVYQASDKEIYARYLYNSETNKFDIRGEDIK